MSSDDVDQFAERIYFTGDNCYHTRKECSNYGIHDAKKVSLIRLSRTGLSPCGKCNPPEKPTEFAVCIDCGWECPVADSERTRGYKGACPACGSAKTSSDFRLEKQSRQPENGRSEGGDS